MNSTFAAASPNRPNWLVGVPSQWEIAPIKAKADVRNGATPSSGEERFWEGEIPWATPVDLGVLELRHTGRYITREGYESCGTALVPAGSVIVSTRAPIGSLALAGVDMCFNQGCRGLVPGDDVSGRFLYYALSAFSGVLQVYGEGTTFKELSSSSLADFPIAWPSIDEQIAIASYLDAETARIDDLIERKRALKDLLAELRSAIISDAVLGRIDVSTGRRCNHGDGVTLHEDAEGCGEVRLHNVKVPSHWVVTPMGHLMDAIKDGTHGSFQRVDVGRPLLSAKNVLDGRIQIGDAESQISEEDFASITANGFPAKGDLLMTIVGSIGRSCVYNLEEPHAFQRSVCFIRLDKRCNPKYFRYVSQYEGFQKELLLRAKVSAQAGVYMGDVKRIPVPLPPLDEQDAIASYLDAETARIDELIVHVDREIALLQELRSATITDAVLGRVDVREHMKH